MHVPVFGVKVPPVGGHARLAVVDEGAETRYCRNVLFIIHCNDKINMKEGNVLFNDALNTFHIKQHFMTSSLLMYVTNGIHGV